MFNTVPPTGLFMREKEFPCVVTSALTHPYACFMLPTDSNGLRWSNRSQGILTGRQLSPSITPAKGNHRKLVRTPRTRLKPDCVVFLRVSNLRLPTPALLRMPTAVRSWLSPLTPISLSRRQPVFCNLCSNFNPCFPGTPNSVLLLSKTGGTNTFNVDIIGMQIVCHLLLKTVRVRSINDCATPWLPHSTEQGNVRESLLFKCSQLEMEENECNFQ